MTKVGNTFWGMSLSLTIICLIFTGLMAVVYEVTLEPIAESKRSAQAAAIEAVQPEFDTLQTDTVSINGKSFPVFLTYKDGEWCGTAVESTTQGFGGDFTIMAGFDKEGKIIDYDVLSHGETPGLGSKMDKWFKEKASINGRDMNSGSLTVSKDGGDVDAITAATITSRAFLSAVNNAFEAYKVTKQQQ